jgi:uncharacterized coiled-coil DUF342 family protein
MLGTSQNRQRETTEDLSAKLRAAEQRIKELEAKVLHHEDRADRAERWLHQVSVEIEEKFFGGDAVRVSQPPSTHSETR